MIVSTMEMMAATALRAIVNPFEAVLAEAITTKTHVPISSEAAKLNAAIHSTMTTSVPRMTAATMRRANHFAPAGFAVGSAGLFIIRSA
jgi:hypothetical protein